MIIKVSSTRVLLATTKYYSCMTGSIRRELDRLFRHVSLYFSLHHIPQGDFLRRGRLYKPARLVAFLRSVCFKCCLLCVHGVSWGKPVFFFSLSPSVRCRFIFLSFSFFFYSLSSSSLVFGLVGRQAGALFFCLFMLTLHSLPAKCVLSFVMYQDVFSCLVRPSTETCIRRRQGFRNPKKHEQKIQPGKLSIQSNLPWKKLPTFCFMKRLKKIGIIFERNRYHFSKKSVSFLKEIGISFLKNRYHFCKIGVIFGKNRYYFWKKNQMFVFFRLFPLNILPHIEIRCVAGFDIAGRKTIRCLRRETGCLVAENCVVLVKKLDRNIVFVFIF